MKTVPASIYESVGNRRLTTDIIVHSNRGTQYNPRQASVLDIASVHDHLWALIREPGSKGPKLAVYLPHLNVWDMAIELPDDAHKILDNPFNKSFSGLYVLRKSGILLQVPSAVSEIMELSFRELGMAFFFRVWCLMYNDLVPAANPEPSRNLFRDSGKESSARRLRRSRTPKRMCPRSRQGFCWRLLD